MNKNIIKFILASSLFILPITSVNAKNKQALYQEPLYFEFYNYDDKLNANFILPDDIIPLDVKISNSSIIVSIIDNKINLSNLNKNDIYFKFDIIVTDTDNKEHIFEISEFSTPNEVELTPLDVNVTTHEGEYIARVMLPDDLKGKITYANVSNPTLLADTADGVVTLFGLNPNEKYSNLNLALEDNDNNAYVFILNPFSTYEKIKENQVNTDNKLDNYLSNAYIKAFDRDEIDMEGFNFWIKKLSNKEIGAVEFILNLLNTDEFIKISKDPEDKIKRLYAVIFNREPDNSGFNFWVNEYNNDLEYSNDEKTSINNIVNRMLESDEFKEICVELNINY